ncbi:unnamed protein product, partial [Effrenium voratum]
AADAQAQDANVQPSKEADEALPKQGGIAGAAMDMEKPDALKADRGLAGPVP